MQNITLSCISYEYVCHYISNNRIVHGYSKLFFLLQWYATTTGIFTCASGAAGCC